MNQPMVNTHTHTHIYLKKPSGFLNNLFTNVLFVMTFLLFMFVDHIAIKEFIILLL